jgi:hypothetical protein
MIFESNGRVRLTPDELNRLRQLNARNGEVINIVETRDDLLRAILGALSPERVADMLEFMETGNSPLTLEASASRAGITQSTAPTEQGNT